MNLQQLAQKTCSLSSSCLRPGAGRLHLDRAVRPSRLHRELPETAQGEQIEAPQNPTLIEARNTVEFVNLGL